MSTASKLRTQMSTLGLLSEATIDGLPARLKEASSYVEALLTILDGVGATDVPQARTHLLDAARRYGTFTQRLIARAMERGTAPQRGRLAEDTEQTKSDILDALGYATGVLLPWFEAAQSMIKRDKANAEQWKKLAAILDQMASLANDAEAIVRRVK